MIESNPFATRFTRPGAIPYLFPPGDSAEQLIERLRTAQWLGGIVGPHGAGKSTVLATLQAALRAAGRQVITASLHAGDRALPATTAAWKTWDGNTQLLVDGYEQLSWRSRKRLIAQARRQGAGLLVTSHAPLDLPTVLEVKPSLATAITVVRQLVSDDTLIAETDINQAFQDCAGNMRETLFQLFDLYSLRTR